MISVTVPDLKPDPQEKSAFYLEKIYVLLANANISLSSIPVTPATPPPFSPPNYVICVNSLLFLSLIISLTYAMLAVMLQQWARRYLRITQTPRPPHDAARICAFFARGFEEFRFSLVAEAIPTLIHISLFLLFSGLLIYLFNINTTVFRAVLWWIAAVAVGYSSITIIPIWRVDSPYYSPFSSLAFRVYAALIYLFASRRFRDLAPKYFAGVHKGTEEMAEKEITTRSRKIDSFILKWSFDAHSLASDRELGQFFNNIYGLYNSTTIPDPRGLFAALDSRKFSPVLEAFMKRTFSPTSLSDPRNMAQFEMCLKLADATDSIDLFLQAKHLSAVQAIHVGHSLNQNRRDGKMGLVAQTIVADIIVSVDERDERWIELAVDQFGKSRDEIQRYFKNGNDNVLLSTWTHMARQISNSSAINPGMASDAASFILDLEQRSEFFEFDIRNTLPELQHEFCSVWNDIVPEAQEKGNGSVLHLIVFLLRSLYIDLHPDTDDAQAVSFDKFEVLSYPLCNKSHHHLGEIADIPLYSLVLAHPRPLADPSPSRIVLDGLKATISPETNTGPAPSQQVAGASRTSKHDDIVIGPYSPADSSVNESDGPPHGLVSSSLSPVAAFLSVDPSVPSFSDPSAPTTIAILKVDEDTQERNTSGQVEPPITFNSQQHQSRMSSQGRENRDSMERSASSPHG